MPSSFRPSTMSSGNVVRVLELRGDRDDPLVGELADEVDDLALLVGELIESEAHAGAVIAIPAASPRATTASAIFREASSIIWPSCMTAPLRSTWVAWW